MAGLRVVVTGAGGFIGSTLARRLSREGARVLAVSRSAPGELEGAEALRGDLRELETWKRAVAGADAVFHLAAQTSATAADRDPAADRAANVLPMRRLLDACLAARARPFVVFAGTATQCGLADAERIDESLPDRPATAYDRHKLEAERMLEAAARAGEARGTTLRLANVYGPWGGGGRSDRGVLNRMMARALRGEDLTLHGDGAQRRDYLHVEDVADAMLAALACAARTDGRHFLLGSGEGRALAAAFAEVAAQAGRLTGRPARVVRVAPPVAEAALAARSVTIDAARFREATGWAPRIPFEEGVRRSLADLRRRATAAA